MDENNPHPANQVATPSAACAEEGDSENPASQTLYLSHLHGENQSPENHIGRQVVDLLGGKLGRGDGCSGPGSLEKKSGQQHMASRLSSLLKIVDDSGDKLFSAWQSDKMKAMVALAVNGALCTYPADVGVEFTRNRQWSYFDLLSDLSGSSEPFVDPSFPQDLSGLCDVGDPKMVERFERYEWKRPKQIFDSPYHIFYDSIEPDDIKQGNLGDCYFLSALSSLAEWPDRVRKLFLSDELQFHGCYGVLFCIRGQFQNVIVDDAFPCHAGFGGTPAFSRGHGCELWVMILEKAWAKRYGNYHRIESGMTSDCLAAFTGAPVKTLSASDNDLWDQVRLGEEMNWIMSAGKFV